jgi:GNAT superfamily N-acetyltransferase
MITIKEAKTKAEITDYVKFPFTLYKDEPNWVPPLINDEVNSFDKNQNPLFDNADAHFYLAYRDGKIVGRITAIINWDEVNNQGKKKVRFGWWDVIDDLDVTKALLEKVYAFGKQNNLEYVEGPMGFSNLDKVGVLTEGFDQMGNMITWYNFPYYITHLEKLGYTPEKEYIESIFPFSNVNPALFEKAEVLIKKRYKLHSKDFTKIKDVMPYVDEMFDLFNNAYSVLASFVAITDLQKEYFKKKYISLINPEYIKFIFDENNKLIAFGIVMPDFSEALQKAKGKLFPFGFYHMLKAKNHSKRVLFYLIGIAPEYQNKGVTAIIFKQYYDTFTEKGIIDCVRTPELLENTAIHAIWKHFDPIINKRRKTFTRTI